MLSPLSLVSAQRAVSIEEAELLARVARGDDVAFERLYQIFHRRLLRFLMRFARSHELAEEIINDTLFQVWKNAGAFEGRSSASTWILGVAHRCAMRTLTRRPAPPQVSDIPVAELCDVDDADPSSETGQWIERALEELPLEQRMALELAYYFGYSCEEIALIVDCPANTVKTRLFHARRRLRESLPRLAGPDPH